MNQTTFIDPATTVPVDPAPANTGNGTISTPVVSSATLTENFTIACTVPGGSGVAQFSVVGSVSGSLGTATSNVEFVDANRKVRFTLTAGGTPWAVGDNFTFSTTAGTVLNQTKFTTLVNEIMFELALQNWTERVHPKNQSLNSIVWNGTIFCAVGDNGASTDSYVVLSQTHGENWIERTLPKIDVGLNGVTWNGSIFCAVGSIDSGTDAYIVTSPDGSTWTERSNPKNVTLEAIAWNGSIFCAVGRLDGTDAYILTSPDGITWTERANPKNFDLFAIAWNGSVFCAVGNQDGTDAYIVTSPDGITWTERANPKNFQLFGIAWNGSLFCAVGSADGTDAYIITSPDGITWTERTNPRNAQLLGIGFGNGTFVAVGSSVSFGATYMVTSPDGIVWTERMNGKTVGLNDVAWNGKVWVAVGEADGTSGATDSYMLSSLIVP